MLKNKLKNLSYHNKILEFELRVKAMMFSQFFSGYVHQEFYKINFINIIYINQINYDSVNKKY